MTASEAAPNIVVIMTDDQEDTGSMAYMPKLHALLAEQGVTFTNSFVNLPLCAPSRASFLTGLSAHNTGIKANNPADGGGWEAFKDKEANALPVWLDRAGYKTALLGKYVNRYGQQSNFGALLAWAGNLVNVELKGATIGNPRDWVPPGWDLWYAFTEWRARYFDYAVNENGTILHFGYRPDDYSTDVLKERATRFIADQASKPDPFFMLIATKAVHAQGSRAIPAPRDAQDLAGGEASHRPLVQSQGCEPQGAEDALRPRSSKAKLAKAYRAELQSLQSVDDLVEAVVEALKQSRQARRHSDRLHLRQRVPVWPAPADRQVGALRGVDQGSARHARSRHPERRDESRAREQSRCGRDHRRACGSFSRLRARRPVAHPALRRCQCALAERASHREPGQPLPEV